MAIHTDGPDHVKPPISNRTYDFLKWVALIVLPGLGALYFGLAELWNLPKAHEVSGTVLVLDTFLGLILGRTSQTYNKSSAKFDGALVVDIREDKDIYSFEVDDLDQLKNKSELVFKVKAPPNKG